MPKKREGKLSEGDLFAPDTYRAMSEPFVSDEEATAALRGFTDDLYEIRKKHRIADVNVTIKVDVRDGERISNTHIGSTLNALPMIAWAYGRERLEHEALIARMAKGGR